MAEYQDREEQSSGITWGGIAKGVLIASAAIAAVAFAPSGLNWLAEQVGDNVVGNAVGGTAKGIASFNAIVVDALDYKDVLGTKPNFEQSFKTASDTLAKVLKPSGQKMLDWLVGSPSGAWVRPAGIALVVAGTKWGANKLWARRVEQERAPAGYYPAPRYAGGYGNGGGMNYQQMVQAQREAILKARLAQAQMGQQQG